MAWRRPGDKPLSEPMMVSLLTHICVTRPQRVKWLSMQAMAGRWPIYTLKQRFPPTEGVTATKLISRGGVGGMVGWGLEAGGGILQTTFANASSLENIWYFVSNYMEVNQVLIDYESAFVLVIAWHRTCDKSLLEPLMTHISDTARLRWATLIYHVQLIVIIGSMVSMTSILLFLIKKMSTIWTLSSLTWSPNVCCELKSCTVVADNKTLIAIFSVFQTYRLHSLNHVEIWQVLPQLSCDGTCQIWT